MTKRSRGGLFGWGGRSESRAAASALSLAPSPAPAPSPVQKIEARARPTSPTPDEALAWLLEGNAIFVSGSTPAAPHLASEVANLAAGQRPLAVILGCSDSRAGAEILFQTRMGDLFVVRVAGNTADALGLGSIDYAVHYLKCPLVVVLGHSTCGAVSAAVSMVVEHAHFEPPVSDVLEPILPAVLEAQSLAPADLVDASVRMHVKRVAARLKTAPSLKPPLDEGRLKIVAAHYDLNNGKVEVIG